MNSGTRTHFILLVILSIFISIGCSQGNSSSSDEPNGEQQGSDENVEGKKGGHQHSSEEEHIDHAVRFLGDDGWGGECGVLVALPESNHDSTSVTEQVVMVKLDKKLGDGHEIAALEGAFYYYDFDRDLYEYASSVSDPASLNAIAGMKLTDSETETSDINQYEELMQKNELAGLMRIDLAQNHTAQSLMTKLGQLLKEPKKEETGDDDYRPFVTAIFVSLHDDHYHTEVCDQLVFSEVVKSE